MDASRYLRLRQQQQTMYLSQHVVRTAGDHTAVVAAAAAQTQFVPTNALRGDTDAAATAACCRVFAGQRSNTLTPVRPIACGAAACSGGGVLAKPGCGC